MGFIDENFLLKTETAKKLFNDYAKNEPIYDFHCHTRSFLYNWDLSDL